nr:unnamed protein product [Spirometra erinaceieuropaei]
MESAQSRKLTQRPDSVEDNDASAAAKPPSVMAIDNRVNSTLIKALHSVSVSNSTVKPTDMQPEDHTDAHDDQFSSDNGESNAPAGAFPDSYSKPPNLSQKTHSCRSRIRATGGSSDIPKNVVHVLQNDGKKIRTTVRSNTKKEKVPDTTDEVARCREERSSYLDLSHLGLQALPAGIFKEVSFIESLFLYGNRLTSLSPSLCSLPNLHRLMLQQNWITCCGLPNEIAKLTQLEVLDLRHNRLEGSLPACIYKLGNLEQLILSYNKLTTLSDDLKNLHRLTVLILNRNFIRQSIPDTIGQLTRLTKLDLSYNHIESLPSSLGNCTCLRELNLQHNQLTHLPDSIGNLGNLTRLSLKYNRLVEIPLTLASCSRLDEFNVENNQIYALPPGLLSNLKLARNITLSRNLFNVFPTAAGGERFCYALTLNMDHNKICEIPPNIISQSDCLIKLNLRDNEIETLIPEDLHTWDQLVELDLGSNHLSTLPSEIEALQALEVFRLGYNQLKSLPQQIGCLKALRILDLESNQLEVLPPSIGCLTSLEELNVSCNRLTTFPSTIESMLNLKQIKAGENDIRELPSEIGNMPVLRDLHLNDNVNLNNLPAELSLCSTLTILGLENCPLRDLPQPIVVHGSAMIIYFLQQVLQLRRQNHTISKLAFTPFPDARSHLRPVTPHETSLPALL